MPAEILVRVAQYLDHEDCVSLAATRIDCRTAAVARVGRYFLFGRCLVRGGHTIRTTIARTQCCAVLVGSTYYGCVSTRKLLATP